MSVINLKTKWAKLSVFSNLILVIFKVVVFFFTGALSILSEAIHSVIDLMAALIAYVSVKKSSMPPDEEHPFGHGKFENLSGFIEAILIILAAFYIVYEAISRFSTEYKIDSIGVAILVMGISALVNFFVSKKLYTIAKRTDSIAIETDAAHIFVDVYTCLAVFAGLVVIHFSGMAFLDPLISVSLAVYIFFLGVKLTIKSTKGLLDTSLPEEETDKIEGIILDHIGKIVSFHKLATRKSGSDKMIEVHIQFVPDISLKEAHEISHHIEDDIHNSIHSSRVTIHIEPCEEHCKNCDSTDCITRKV